MNNPHQDDRLRNFGLSQSFRAWVQPDPEPGPFIRMGLVVLDANVLLHLYRVTAVAREQIFATLKSVESRLWIPHQAATEFHRNRLDVVKGKMSQFRETRSVLSQANARAVAEVRKSIVRLTEFRQHNMTDRKWEPQAYGLDEQSILARLDGIMDPALAELQALQDEHDIGPGDVASDDPILMRLEEITKGKVGGPYDQQRLMRIVREAVEFRFPNEIPPGYKDAEKNSAHRAAGDYILWSQVLDRVSQDSLLDHVALVTNDVKADWWVLDKKGDPTRARPELGQELFERSGAELKLLTLSDFLEAAADQFPGSVSDDTVRAVRKSEVTVRIESMLNELRGSGGGLKGKPNLLELPVVMFEQLIRALFVAMGYEDVGSTPANQYLGYDIIARHPHSNRGDGQTIIEVKLSKSPIGVAAVHQLLGAMQATNAEHGTLVTSSRFASTTRALAVDNNIQLIDGTQLLSLLLEFLGIDATFESNPDEEV